MQKCYHLPAIMANSCATMRQGSVQVKLFLWWMNTEQVDFLEGSKTAICEIGFS